MNCSLSVMLICVILIASTKSKDKSKSRAYPSGGCAAEYEVESPADYFEENLIHDGLERKYLTHLPSSYDHYSTTGYPLILNLHGASSNSYEAMTYTFMNEHANENNYIAVYPDSTSLGEIQIPGMNISGTVWNNLGCAASPTADGPTCSRQSENAGASMIPNNCKDPFGCNYCDCNVDDVGFIDILLDELEDKYCIDRSRIYVTGMSNGAAMAQTLGCELNHRLAAIAPMNGQNVIGYNCSPKYKKKIPILNIWGTEDTAQPGDTIIATPLNIFGQFRLSVYQVQYKYGQHNKCDVENTKYVSIPTVSDGINDWQCVGYDQCDFDQNGDKEIDGMSCSWNGGHVYPVNYEDDANENRDFGLDVMWNFFKDKIKVPPGC